MTSAAPKLTDAPSARSRLPAFLRRNSDQGVDTVRSEALLGVVLYTPSRLVLVVSVIVVYLVFATATEFYALRVPFSREIGAVVGARCFEIMLFWTFLWSGVGLYAGMRSRWFQHEGGAAVVMVGPLSVALPWTFIELWGRAPLIVRTFQYPGSLWIKVMFALSPAIPLALVGGCALMLWAQMNAWKRALRKGVCLECLYDLTGNVSGICPECGTPVGTKRQISWMIGSKWRLDVRWLLVAGLALWLPGVWVYQRAEDRTLAYWCLGSGVVLIIAAMVIGGRLVRRQDRT
jgi:hypothetical protein